MYLPKSVNYLLLLIKRLALVLMLGLLSVPQALAEGVLKVPANQAAYQVDLIELRHRSAVEVLAAIQPHLPQGTVASQQDQQLLLSGDSVALEQLKTLISRLDKPLQTWRVIFSQGQVNRQAIQQSRGRHFSTAHAEVYELLVREGAPARLERGFWLPVQRGFGQERETGYEWFSSGVWVVVKPVGDQLILNLTTQEVQTDKLTVAGKSGFSGRQLASEVALQPGQWITLGSEAQLAAQTSATSRHFTGGSQNEYYSICIEVSDKASCPR